MVVGTPILHVNAAFAAFCPAMHVSFLCFSRPWAVSTRRGPKWSLFWGGRCIWREIWSNQPMISRRVFDQPSSHFAKTEPLALEVRPVRVKALTLNLVRALTQLDPSATAFFIGTERALTAFEKQHCRSTTTHQGIPCFEAKQGQAEVPDQLMQCCQRSCGMQACEEAAAL